MPAVTVSDIPSEVFDALKEMAIENNRTIEQEIVAILEYDLRNVANESWVMQLAAIGRRYNLKKVEVPPRNDLAGHVVFE